ncbi:MAG: cyclodeaminase/cyclohydrolase family protein [Treponema sp.]|jgi:formiminotetrahydrofolate cyclodeaminase|nr:cyclodeaminase/cyclohydrolase family protein [Treponema sp.]
MQGDDTTRLAALSVDAFSAALASKEATPGGGAASAVAGALAAALGGMVANLTAGKKAYAAVDGEMRGLAETAERLRAAFLADADADAAAFAPLAAVYRLPAATPEERARKEALMEERLRAAAAPPLRMMERCGETLALLEAAAEKGSALARSDAGVGALFCKACLLGASLNVTANTRALRDRSQAEALDARARGLIARCAPRADALYARVITL